MAAGVLWKPTQAGFNFSGLSQPVTVPQRSIPIPHGGPASHQMNQLQFKLGKPTSTEQFTTRFRKPQPIIIEKISEQTQTSHIVPNNHVTTPVAYPVMSSVSSSLTSDRLALAVHLAKKDVKKVKEVRTDNVLVSQEEETQNRHVTATGKQKGVSGKKVRVKSGKSKSQAVASEESVTLRERVHNTVKKQEAAAKRQHKLYFYPAPGEEDDEFDSEGERTQANEIRKLRKELHQYMKQMEGLKNDRPEVLKNKDKRLKRRRDGDVRLSDEDVDQRQVVRAEEQAARSARMLYVLQRQVREIEDELNKKRRGIKHTKKSQTLSRLAAAHRGAVRALQTFVSNAPLQPKVGHGLPPMYQELSALIRQLSLLATQLHIGGDDPTDDVKQKGIEDEGRKLESEERLLEADKTPEKPSAFVQEVADRKPQETQTLKTPMKQAITSTPDPTPERDAVLQAGLTALLRAKDTPVQTPVVKPNFQPRPALQAVKPDRPAVIPVKQSLLLPAKLKLKRQRAQQAAKRVKLVQPVDQAHFAKETVSSILKKAPAEGPDKPHPGTQLKTPPRTPTKEGPRTPERGVHYHDMGDLYLSPRSQRRKYEQKLPSPRSPKYARRMLPVDHELIEREVARQRWLDEEAERRIHELERLRRLENMRRDRRSPEALLSKRLVSETEEAIRSRLKPLLDRAEAIADTEVKRETEQKKSLQHQLGKLASQTTMNQADILAEKVLDDVLEETVLEMQRLEVEGEAEIQADNLQNSSTLENILQRLQSFEKVEEEIRRHWAHVKYADVEKSSEKPTAEKSTRQAREPKPIMFTRPDETESNRLLPENTRGVPDEDRSDDRKPLRLLDEVSETSSFSSLMEASTERSSAQSSVYKGPEKIRSPQNRPLATGARPTVLLSVPKEMRASIVSYRNRFNKYLRDSSTHEQGTFDPWGLVNRISEDLLEDTLQEVGDELDHVCGDFAEALYNEEFVSADT
ncbi:hypothetical protein ACROYT_G009771 [Oculina patagonica]